MSDYEATVQEYLKMALPRCSRTPSPITDRYDNPMPPELHEYSLKMEMQNLAHDVWAFCDPEARDHLMWQVDGNISMYEHTLTSGFVSYVNELMLFRGRTFEEAVAEATEVVREAVRRYHDGTIAEWKKSLYTPEDQQRYSEITREHYARVEGRASGQNHRGDLPGSNV